MSRISARDALEYATRDEFLKLYGVLVVGWTLTLVGQSVAAGATPFGLLLGTLVVIAGLLAMLAAAVATLRKILAER
ncbi:hypothetical protein [Halorussus sp. MSC15.2]|uniref:hypothetical protein n=1 Tax=Halorussus sp. MSC15.2 TaxID=2283638 RepID=UPI0013CF6B41|nr:hypothetical protein [Halorussus sp. MSC15.2]NEU57018.1 hypothetical protein [Halorussus sp. MSC15.2]